MNWLGELAIVIAISAVALAITGVADAVDRVATELRKLREEDL